LGFSPNGVTNSGPVPLEVQGVIASYGDNEPVLRGIDLTAESGQITSIIGPNGSGKSSLLRAICGLMNHRAGTVTVHGTDATRLRPKDLRKFGIRYVPQGNASFPGMSVQDNLRLAGWALKLTPAELAEAIEIAETSFGALRAKRKLLAGYLSGGEQRQLEFARTSMGQPKLILLDEPSAGLSPKMTTEMYEAITRLRAADRGIVLVDQNVPKAVEVSDVVYELNLGRVTRRMLPGDQEARAIIAGWLNG
jgi:branched-chain amino acid transport system ATP-binding protein